MKTFSCQCGNTLHFINTQCVKCSSALGFVPDELQLKAITPEKNGLFTVANSKQRYRQCKNYWQHDVCNWLVNEEDLNDYCLSCRLNVEIPNLQKLGNIKLWYNMEVAKRRLLFTLLKLNLPITSRAEDPHTGLGFSFLEDQIQDEYGNELTIKDFVVTGHAAGLITLNLNEAQDSSRVEMREKMNEQYRTLIGHFRHESGHYYWDRLIQNSPKLEEFRALFGDERLCYTESLNSYYQNGPSDQWQNVWISAYASMHPWEDWAETWAHYLNMVDTLETANDFQMCIAQQNIKNPLQKCTIVDDAYTAISFTQLFDDWCKLTRTLNAINRSMGHDEAYPFVISISALNKLRFVHEIIKHAK
ncbi:zinc-binding metallopeptidase family protein [Pseudoalteromonas ulvae]|uniref:Zinc-ribbon domain-containing protein n=1 Tax=Pseudoalteromonas ulvae TaxID=107327 RepID=A0A244CQY7_PSEDV|nr:putative zinc-binding metallopeptidase [Pseudoalteromonas ulvae]OUL58014.1 hypothetical protein B1199_06545 [Pseudoalteromonas ulvae]